MILLSLIRNFDTLQNATHFHQFTSKKMNREDSDMKHFVQILTSFLERHNAFLPDEAYTGNLYKCHVWNKLREMKETSHIPLTSHINDLILLRDGREFSTATDPLFFRIIKKEHKRYNIVLIDNEDGVEHLIVSLVPSRCEIWSVKTKNYRLLAIIKTIHQVYSMYYEGEPTSTVMRYDEAEVDGESEEEDCFEIDQDAQVLSGVYGWPSGKYLTI